MPTYGWKQRKVDPKDWNIERLSLGVALASPPIPGPTLNQGTNPACAGFAGTDTVNCEPFPASPSYDSSDALAVYRACKSQDGSPDQPGTDNRTLAKVLKAWGKIDSYAFANNTNDIIQWVKTSGAGVFGAPWSYSMEKPVNGVITFDPNSGIAGGHDTALLWYFDLVPGCSEGGFLGQNSWGNWGTQWNGQGGFYYILKSTVDTLIANGADFLMPNKISAPHDVPPVTSSPTPVPQGNGCLDLIASLLQAFGAGTSQAQNPVR